MRHSAKLSADDVGGKSRAQKASIDRSDFAFSQTASYMRKLPLQTRPNQRALVGLREHGIERGLDVAIGDAAPAKLAGNAETALASRVGMLTGVCERILCIVEILLLPQARDHGRDDIRLLRPAFEIFAHLVDGMRAPGQCAQRKGVQFLFGGYFARGISHGKEA